MVHIDPQPFSPEMEALAGWTSVVPVAQMCLRAYGRRVSVVDVRVLCTRARGERFLGVINIITQANLVCVARITDDGDPSISSPTMLYTYNTIEILVGPLKEKEKDSHLPIFWDKRPYRTSQTSA